MKQWAGTIAPNRIGWMIGRYMQNDKCRHLRKQEGEQRARTLLNREMNPSETSNREMSGSDQLSENSGCQLTVSEQHHKKLVSERKAEQANRALTLKGRRLWCHRCDWFGHRGGWEGILGGCAEGIGDLWAQGADTLCFPFYLWHCKTNTKWLQTETFNNPKI